MNTQKLYAVVDPKGNVVAVGMTKHQAWTQDYGDCVPATWVDQRMMQGYQVKQVELSIVES